MDWTSWGKPAMAVDGASPVIFLPGWGCSGRMLSLCAPARAWWSVTGQLAPSSLLAELEAFVRGRLWPRVILVGWSMGARPALEFASRHPGKIEALILLSVRREWPAPEVAAIRRQLLLDPAAFLKEFYRKCFLGRKEAWRRFVAEVQEVEVRERHLSALKAGLALLQTPLEPAIDALRQSGFPLEKVWLLHGASDIIAPCRQRLQLAGTRQLILKHEGHALFLAPSVRGLTFLAQVPCPENRTNDK